MPTGTPGRPTCSIEGCEKPNNARGWCDMHYARWLKYGDPGAAKTPGHGGWKHRLSNIDPVARTADCTECGCGVGLLSRGPNGWRCQEAERSRDRQRGLRHETIECRQRRKRRERERRLLDLSLTCEGCGFVASHRAQLDIHHRDGNHGNNDRENLAQLCACCHRLEHVIAA